MRNEKELQDKDESKAVEQIASKAAEGVMDAYHAIEHGVVDAYHKIEDGVANAYKKVENGVVEASKAVENTKKRMAEESKRKT